MDRNKHLRIFTDCYLVDGDNGYLIYDLSRERLISLGKTAYHVLKEIDGKSIDSILSKFGNEIIKILDYFVAEEICFLTDAPGSFPKISKDFHLEYECYSAILEIGTSGQYDCLNAINELNQLGCQMLMISIKSTSNITADDIYTMINSTKDSFLRCIDIVVPSSFENTFSMDFLNHNARICSITYLGAKQSESEQKENGVLIKRVTDEDLDWSEKIIRQNFSFTLKSFMEAKKYNIALNRKISIDELGFIRNYINHHDHFGDFSDGSISISQVFRSPEFQKKWSIGNDFIEKCKNCKFRYCCFSNTDVHYSDGKWRKEKYCPDFMSI